jgi:hypothetical protein
VTLKCVTLSSIGSQLQLVFDQSNIENLTWSICKIHACGNIVQWIISTECRGMTKYW